MKKNLKTPLSYNPESLPRELKRHYISATDGEIEAMLESVGANSFKDLFSQVREEVFMKTPPAIPEELPYQELLEHMESLSLKNNDYLSFLGDGLQHYATPNVVPHVLSIRNLTTAYTPYQPERSQGTLMSLWIYQSSIAALTGFEAINASFYDRSTALFEALKCAQRLSGGKNKVIVAESIYPGDWETITTLACYTDLEIIPAKIDQKTGTLSINTVRSLLEKEKGNIAALAFPQTNFYGLLEDVDALTDLAEEFQIRSIAVVDPMTLGTGGLKPPSEYGKAGASLFVGEGQHISIPPNYGGPGLGIFGIRFNEKNKTDIRQTAGRFVGRAKDSKGRDCFAMILSTREQHIRRDKATSNICSNQSYIATLTGAALLERGAEGLAKIATQIQKNTEDFFTFVTAREGITFPFNTPFYNEIVLQFDRPVEDILQAARKEKIHLGVDVSGRGGLKNAILIAFTDRHSIKEIDLLRKFFEREFPKTKSSQAIPARKNNRTSLVKLPKISVDKIKSFYTSLGEQNVSPDDHIYALGSCTMKYNPYINDWAALLPGFANIHPQAPFEDSQGCLEVIYETQEYFKAITGLPALTTQPMAGAQGELVGLKMFQAYHEAKKENRDIILIPRSAHGTNPATATMAGYKSENIKLIEADTEGRMNLEQVKSLVQEFGSRIAGLMVTNPNTSGILETNFKDVATLIHSVDGLVYMDGANMNAIAGWMNLETLGVDAVHNNTHKTWSIPHGGGGPGDAFVAVSKKLEDYMPGIQVIKKEGKFSIQKPSKSIGSVQRHFGNFAHKVRAYTYIRALGKEGVRKMSAYAVLSARYLFAQLSKQFPTLPAESESIPRMHEFILTLSKDDFARVESAGIPKAMVIPRIGKLFLDFGLHAPTVAFPETLGLMVEPTESYSKAELDDFISTVTTINKIVKETPEVLHTVPHFTPIDRVDEVSANKAMLLSEEIPQELYEILPNRADAIELTKMAKGDLWKKITEAHKQNKA
ncbi:MAG: aminomethyl-transferring glycine dehydrogenase subunit GcvPB [Oligoflexia bacterium]|nr:aminomethyl-transferring glycine dehydrogenase subunit GcvPB [Oligoflexia bacterium]